MKPMTLVGVLLCVACQALIVVGQLFIKHAVNAHDADRPAGASRADRRRRLAKTDRNFVAGIGCLTCWFFLWLGLLGKWDISKLFPFEGLNPALMAIAAWLVLKEKLPVTAWAGLALVCAGIAVVSGS